MAKTRKKNPFLGETIEELIAEEKARDPKFAVEFDRLALARMIRTLREAKKLSQAELAKRAHTQQPAIARLEGGAVIPRLDLLQKIASAMGMRVRIQFEPAK